MRGYSEDPNAGTFAGNEHLDSIIYYGYISSLPSDNFPVQGYVVGKTKSIWAYNRCSAPDFGISPTYESLFTSPQSNKNVGFISKIELDQSSCKGEEVSAITSVVFSSGVGRDDTGDGMVTNI